MKKPSLPRRRTPAALLREGERILGGLNAQNLTVLRSQAARLAEIAMAVADVEFTEVHQVTSRLRIASWVHGWAASETVYMLAQGLGGTRA